MYLTNDLMFEVSVKLTKADGVTTIGKDQHVAPINNILHSLISSCNVSLNNVPINDTINHYPYRSYITDLLGFDSNARYSWMEATGFYLDTASFMNNAAGGNDGFNNRRRLWRNAEDKEYTGLERTFMGRLHTDLDTIEGGIIPGVEIRVVLTLAKPEFVLMVKDNDQNDYKIVLTKASLWIPVATIRPEVFKKIEHSLEKGPCHYYIEKVQIREKNIPANSSTFYTENLFATVQLPARMILAFLPTSAFLGDFHKNSFDFQRKWEAAPAAWRGGVGGNKCFIEKISVTLNGRSLDGLESRAVLQDDMTMFVRLNHLLGYQKSRTGNSITYPDFLNGFYLAMYDVSTSGQSAVDYVIPAVKDGNLRLAVEFSSTTQTELTCLIFAEFPSVIQIDKFRRISQSY
jgi:hypothetical protein